MIVIMTSKDGRNFISVSPHGIDGPHNLLPPAFWPLIVAVALRSVLRSRRSAQKDHRARSSQRRLASSTADRVQRITQSLAGLSAFNFAQDFTQGA
ncbi:MAG: hypothetical protein ACYCSR_11190 [Thiomonas sp.]